MSWFVRPATTTLHLDGQTLIVRDRLSTGEARQQMARMTVTTPDGRLRVDSLQVGMATVTAYLLDWSLVDDDGAPIPIKGLSVGDLEQVLNDLDPERFGAILAAIQAHEKARTQQRADLKKTTPGDPWSSPILSSPVAAAGGTNGSPTLTPTSTTS